MSARDINGAKGERIVAPFFRRREGDRAVLDLVLLLSASRSDASGVSPRMGSSSRWGWIHTRAERDVPLQAGFQDVAKLG
jgi:hypothetical protein